MRTPRPGTGQGTLSGSCLECFPGQEAVGGVPQQTKPDGNRHWGPPTGRAHSHLLPHLLEVIEELQGRAEAFCNEAAALAAPAHEPTMGEAVSPGVPCGTQGCNLPAPHSATPKEPEFTSPSSPPSTLHLGMGPPRSCSIPSADRPPGLPNVDKGCLSSPLTESLPQGWGGVGPTRPWTGEGPGHLAYEFVPCTSPRGCVFHL